MCTFAAQLLLNAITVYETGPPFGQGYKAPIGFDLRYAR